MDGISVQSSSTERPRRRAKTITSFMARVQSLCCAHIVGVVPEFLRPSRVIQSSAEDATATRTLALQLSVTPCLVPLEIVPTSTDNHTGKFRCPLHGFDGCKNDINGRGYFSNGVAPPNLVIFEEL